MSAATGTDPLLSIIDLTVDFDVPAGTVHAVDHLDLDVRRGEVVGVVGESGCGKTVSMLAVLGLVPPPHGHVSGTILFEGRDLTTLKRRHLRRIRGNRIAMVFQDPMTSLNPVFTIGRQMTSVIRTHDPAMSRDAARARAADLLTRVGVPDARSRLGDYPHEWSGGMRQRAMIAMAIANEPDLLIADEPTTALDVTIQAQVLDVLRVIREESGAAMIIITHDLGLVAELADRVVVMYAGRAVEQGPAERIFHDPRHPYTLGLLSSLPRLDSNPVELATISGQPPTLLDVPSGCAFHPRCAIGSDRTRCAEEVPALAARATSHHLSACHYSDEVPAQVTRVIEAIGVDPTAPVGRGAGGSDA